MAKGNSKLGAGGDYATSVKVQSGEVVQLNKPLRYGEKDAAITGSVRDRLEEQEDLRKKAKIEYGMAVDANGRAIEVRKGGGGQVKVSRNALNNAEAYTHNHPRSEGNKKDPTAKYQLSGTFSEKDLQNFSNYNVKTYRASGAEGTYSITKGKNFNKAGFLKYVSDSNAQRVSQYQKIADKINDDYTSGKIKDYKTYLKTRGSMFNDYLVSGHNDLLAGQKKYGYTYTLERR